MHIVYAVGIVIATWVAGVGFAYGAYRLGIWVGSVRSECDAVERESEEG